MLAAGERPLAVYPVSTARNGVGERRGSGCTPRGWHRIRIKIGAGLPVGTVFVGRRPTGEIYDPELAARYPEGGTLPGAGLDPDPDSLADRAGARPQPGRRVRYSTPVHLHSRLSGCSSRGRAAIARLHPHAQPRFAGVVRAGDRRRSGVGRRLKRHYDAGASPTRAGFRTFNARPTWAASYRARF